MQDGRVAMMERALSVREVANLLGVSVPTVRRLLRLKALGCIRIGRRLTIPAAEIERYAAAQFQAARHGT
jgi:excisionase family DNA binding protein